MDEQLLVAFFFWLVLFVLLILAVREGYYLLPARRHYAVADSIRINKKHFIPLLAPGVLIIGSLNFKFVEDWSLYYHWQYLPYFACVVAWLDMSQSVLLSGLSAWILFSRKHSYREVLWFSILLTGVIVLSDWLTRKHGEHPSYPYVIQAYRLLGWPNSVWSLWPLLGFGCGSLLGLCQQGHRITN